MTGSARNRLWYLLSSALDISETVWPMQRCCYYSVQYCVDGVLMSCWTADRFNRPILFDILACMRDSINQNYIWLETILLVWFWHTHRNTLRRKGFLESPHGFLFRVRSMTDSWSCIPLTDVHESGNRSLAGGLECEIDGNFAAF